MVILRPASDFQGGFLFAPHSFCTPICFQSGVLFIYERVSFFLQSNALSLQQKIIQ